MSDISGILPVSKPRGWTSFDVIGKLRGVLRIKRLGHGGTLDPMAEGVLPVFVGKATKCCDILPDKRKSYVAGFKLGISSDTQDITGEIIQRSERAVERAELEAAISGFIGDIEQLPPMYSAVKVNGKKLYELAREGKTAERKPRSAHVERIEILEYDETAREGSLAVDCGQGTYVRTLINDIGELLGSGGVMTSLIRTRSGGFTLEQCFDIWQIEEISANGGIGDIILPTDKAFEIYAQRRLGERETALYKNGVKLRPVQAGFDKPCGGTWRIYGADGEFLGLAGFVGGELRSVKNFY